MLKKDGLVGNYYFVFWLSIIVFGFVVGMFYVLNGNGIERLWGWIGKGMFGSFVYGIRNMRNLVSCGGGF